MSQVGNPEWPPRSPHDVLKSTPGGRKRLQLLAERRSPSPSPLKRTGSTHSIRNRGKDLMKLDMDGGDSDDDEETLQLQLQEIQARLKLKKLQKKSKQGSDTENEARTGSRPLSRANSVAASRAQARVEGLREERLEKERSMSQAGINVPVSPLRRAQPAQAHTSPQRVLLGIDKGLTGRDISLKRAPSLRKREDAEVPERRLGPFLQRPASQAAGRDGSFASSRDEDRPKSFSERMAAMRAQQTDRQERELRIKRNRSTAFNIDQDQMQSFKEAAVEFPSAPHRAPEFSRDDILNGINKPSSTIPRSKTTPNLRSAMRDSSATTNSTSTARTDSRASVDIPPRKREAVKPNVPPSEVTEADASQFEPYSTAHLSKRIIPHQVLTRTLTGKKTFLVPDLLRTVKAPDFQGPDIEEDVVVFAIIAKKTQPMKHNQNAKNDNRGKYMIMGLTDLKWELDLFLFDSAFDKFWKLTTGTIIAILNPGFMPPPKGREDTGKFSLVLNSDADTILEIGSARDLGFCKSIRKDGKTCDSWVDKRHTEFCDFHVNQTLAKTHSKRMEVNTMNFGKGDYGRRKYNSQDVTNRGKKEADQKVRYDKGSHSQIYVNNKTTVNKLDDVDFDPDAFHRGSSKEERMTRQLLAKEKERDLEDKLRTMGEGLGAVYMRPKPSNSKAHPSHSHPSNDIAPTDAASLGLLSGKAKDVALSPIKRKRANTGSSSAAIGWGNNLSKELGRMKDGESLQPVKKKTRFVTEKGIREAGRESLGGEVAKEMIVTFSSDDDDELDIVRE
ncbi:DNA replication licensing factor [Lachnellula hyalina]|uniref:DNA replication licensing factor n=1 Tax=Lachnellula hyalina TaxID=1316788 RepID=A0A8H8R650_9HELO|nr:DNA replication licensing factor [Lachnellula hyalina]TVY28230.1 DNA replication licensing factor [Lachnellula hyalina]